MTSISSISRAAALYQTASPAPARPAAAATTGAQDAAATSGAGSVLARLSTLLGTDSDSLKTQLSSGARLSTLLQDSGVSRDAVSSTLRQGDLLDTRA